MHTRILDPRTFSTMMLSLAFPFCLHLGVTPVVDSFWGEVFVSFSWPYIEYIFLLLHNSLLQVFSLFSSRSYCQMPLSLPPSPFCTSQSKETSDIGGTIMEWLARTTLTRFPFRLAVVLPWSLGSQRSSEALSLCSNKCHSLLALFWILKMKYSFLFFKNLLEFPFVHYLPYFGELCSFINVSLF